MDNNNEVNELDFISNDFLSEVKGDEPVSSSMLDKIFIPSRTVPKAITEKIRESDETAEKIALNELPLLNTIIEKPYWSEKRLVVEIFGAICLAADRHMLDVIISHGTMINNASRYTLRQVVEGGIKIDDVDWTAYKNQNRIDEVMSNTGTYFHITAKELCKGMSIKLHKSSRKTIVNRIRRLRNMELKITPEINGNLIPNKTNEIHLLGRDYHTLLDCSQMKSAEYDKDTYTDLIINVDNFYIRSLENDGIISRSRLKNHYPHLVGKNNLEDVYKWLDSHKRSWIHRRFLSELIIQYFDNKIAIFGINRNYKLKQLFNQFKLDEHKFLKHFGIKLIEVENPNEINKKVDYMLYHVKTGERENNSV